MEALDAIFFRRSVRKYSDAPIEEEKINKIMHAAMLAPTARNLQSWKFILIDKRDYLDELAEIHPYARMLIEAPLAVCVCGDSSASPDYYAIDGAIASENILLAAKALGISSVWLGVYPLKERIGAISRFLNLPEKITPISLIALGYSKETDEQEIPERFDANKIYYNKWGGKRAIE